MEYRRLLGDFAGTFLSVFSMDCISSIYAPGYGDNILYYP